ncbi:hypothetical protein PpBr36_03037, partial [Pyricularia pennisetigena]|uniref:hypothetical protein n=1 Tax=Pyricularia pennisetigena TaxID=1578925 RepID=UPI001152D855
SACPATTIPCSKSIKSWPGLGVLSPSLTHPLLTLLNSIPLVSACPRQLFPLHHVTGAFSSPVRPLSTVPKRDRVESGRDRK